MVMATNTPCKEVRVASQQRLQMKILQGDSHYAQWSQVCGVTNGPVPVPF